MQVDTSQLHGYSELSRSSISSLCLTQDSADSCYRCKASYKHHLEIDANGHRKLFVTDDVTLGSHLRHCRSPAQSDKLVKLRQQLKPCALSDHPHLEASHCIHRLCARTSETQTLPFEDECSVRQSLMRLLEERELLRSRLSLKQLASSSWRQFELSPPGLCETAAWVVSPLTGVLTNLCLSRNSLIFPCRKSVVLEIKHTRYVLHASLRDKSLACVPGIRIATTQGVFNADGTDVRLDEPLRKTHNSDILWSRQDLRSWESNNDSPTVSVDSKKRHRIVQLDERKATHANRRSEKLSQQLQSRLSRARDREFDRWGRLLRRAAELDVTRCCNDVRTLLQARWQCEEANLSVGSPPSVAGGSNIPVCKLAVSSSVAMPAAFGKTCVFNLFKGYSLHSQDSLELCDLLTALGPMSKSKYTPSPSVVEIDAAMCASKQAAGSYSCRELEQGKLLKEAAQLLVKVLMPRICRQLSGHERSQSPNSSSLPFLFLNDLTWPCFARLAMLTCAYREIGFSEPEIVSKLRGSTGWVPFPQVGSSERDTLLLLRRRADYLASHSVLHMQPKGEGPHNTKTLVNFPRPVHIDEQLSARMNSAGFGKDSHLQPGFTDYAGPLKFKWILQDVNRNETMQHVVERYNVLESTATNNKDKTSFRITDTKDVEEDEKKIRQLLSFLSKDPEFVNLGMLADASSDTGVGLPLSLSNCLSTQDGHLNQAQGNSLASYISSVRNLLCQAEICGFESVDCHESVGKAIAKFEAYVVKMHNDVVDPMNCCSMCHRDIGLAEHSTRCYRCDSVCHRSCTSSLGILASTENERPSVFCSECVTCPLGPSPGDGWIYSPLYAREDNKIECVGRIDCVVRNAHASVADDLLCCRVQKTADGRQTRLNLLASVTFEKSCWNAGWGIPSNLKSQTVCTETSRSEGKQSSRIAFEHLLSAASALSEDAPTSSYQWACVIRGLLHVITSSNELFTLFSGVADELCGEHRHKYSTSSVPILRLRPRIEIAEQPSFGGSLIPQVRPVERFDDDPYYSQIQTIESKSDCRHNEQKVITQQRRNDNGIRHASGEFLGEDENASSIQSRRKEKEGQLVASVIEASAACVNFEDVESTGGTNRFELISMLVAAAEKRGASNSRADLPVLCVTKSTDTVDSAFGEGDSDSTRQCYLCGGDFDYLNSALSPSPIQTGKAREDAGLANDGGSPLWAHDFCAETKANFQGNISHKTKMRSMKPDLTGSTIWARTSPLGKDVNGHLFWHFSLSGNTVWVQKPGRACNTCWSDSRSISNLDDVPSFARILCVSSDIISAKVLDALAVISPEASLTHGTFPCVSSQKEVVINDVERTMELVDFRLGDSILCDIEEENLRFHHRCGDTLFVRGNRLIWRVSVCDLARRHDDAKCMYQVLSNNWSCIHGCWLEDEHLISPTSAVCYCQTEYFREKSESKALSSPGWVLTAGLRASNFTASPSRYADGFATVVMSSILEVRGVDSNLHRMRAVLVSIEVALPVGSKLEWSEEKSRSRIERILLATMPVQLVELLLLLEDEINDDWISAQWQSSRQHFPSRHFLLRQPSIHWVAVLAWNLDSAIMYEKVQG